MMMLSNALARTMIVGKDDDEYDDDDDDDNDGRRDDGESDHVGDGTATIWLCRHTKKETVLSHSPGVMPW